MSIEAETFMRHAFELARRGLGRISPNPPVGAVAVRDGEIVGEGFHPQFGGPHAEATLIASEPEGHWRGADLYVSLEPCSHHGKTPPCTDAVLSAGFARIFYSVPDPNPKTRGGCDRACRAAGVPCESGLLENEGRHLVAPYLKWTLEGRPLVTAKWAMTLDGRIATASGQSQWISGEESLAQTRRERSHYDAILVGRGTALADDPQLLSPDPDAPQPLRVVLDRRLEVSPTSRLVRSADRGPVLLVSSSNAAADRRALLERRVAEGVGVDGGGVEGEGVEVWATPENSDSRQELIALLEELGRRGVCHLLVEGGTSTHGAFFDAQLVDRAQVIVAPKLVGGADAPGPVGGVGVRAMSEAWRGSNVRVDRRGDDFVWNVDLDSAQ